MKIKNVLLSLAGVGLTFSLFGCAHQPDVQKDPPKQIETTQTVTFQTLEIKDIPPMPPEIKDQQPGMNDERGPSQDGPKDFNKHPSKRLIKTDKGLKVDDRIHHNHGPMKGPEHKKIDSVKVVKQTKTTTME